MLHRREQRAFGVQRLGFGLPLYRFECLYRERLVLFQIWECHTPAVVLFLFAAHGTPSGGLDHRAFGLRFAAAHRRMDFRHLLDAGGGKGFEQTGGDHVVDGLFVFGKAGGQVFGYNQRMVVGHFPSVHAAAVERCSGKRRGILPETRMLPQEGDARGDFVEHVFGNVPAAGARIAQHLFLVQALRKGERAVGGEVQPGVGIPLKGGQVIEQRRFFFDLPPGKCCYAERAARFHFAQRTVCGGLVLVTLFRCGMERNAILLHRDAYLHVLLRGKRLVLQITGANHGQCGCLYPSEREHAPPGGKAERLRAVDADEPVRFAACLGGKIEIIIIAARQQPFHPFADGLVGQAAYPQADKRFGAA